MADVDQDYEEFWKDIVETDGQLDPAKVKVELHDYLVLLHAVPQVYMHITGGKISKPNTVPASVIAAADDWYGGDG